MRQRDAKKETRTVVRLHNVTSATHQHEHIHADITILFRHQIFPGCSGAIYSDGGEGQECTVQRFYYLHIISCRLLLAAQISIESLGGEPRHHFLDCGLNSSSSPMTTNL
jgi:hypothetical protein